MRGKKEGFTLIEILVAISIIAVLMMITLFTFSAVQKKSRDAKRQSDLGLLRGALEQYHADQGFYPYNTPVVGVPQSFNTLVGIVGGVVSPFTNATGNPVSPSVTKIYLKNVPQDPAGGAYQYLAKPNTGESCNNTDTYCTKYSLCATLENTTGTTCSQPSSSAQNFEVTSP